MTMTTSMRLTLLATLAGALTLCAPEVLHAQAATPTVAQARRARTEIRAMFDAAALAWSRGDLDGFMKSYAPETTTTFVLSNGVARGGAAIRARYAPRFAPGGPPHDSLSFEHMEIDVLSPNVASVLAWYRLTRGDSTTARGPTSLVVRKDPIAGWRVIHDHSS